jgi:hypothetical protein
MPDYFEPSSTDLMRFEKYKEELSDWMEANPGVLFKVGGKKKSSNRHHDATHYDPKFFDTYSAYIFSGTLIDSKQAGWLELKLIQFAYSLGFGVNDNRGSPRNMAVLTGSPYNYAEPGCVYLVPVVGAISTQAQYFAVHESHHMVKKKLVEGKGYVKGTHLNPELRKKHVCPKLRKKRAPCLRGKYKKQDLSKRKKQDTSKRKKYTSALRVKRKRRKV